MALLFAFQLFTFNLSLFIVQMMISFTFDDQRPDSISAQVCVKLINSVSIANSDFFHLILAHHHDNFALEWN
jgi:hypothetical protein